MADNAQLPPPGGSAGYSAVAVQSGPEPGRALLAAALLIVAGAVLGLLGGVVWAAAAPRVVYQVYTLKPPTAFAVNPETNAFIAADGIYTFVALGGGALLGLAGYWLGVRRYGAAPMIGIAAGAIAAAFLAQWLGNLLTGGRTFNGVLAASKPGQFLRAPITLGSHGALAFWPVAAALVAGGLELLSVMRARQAGRAPLATAPPPPPSYGRPAQPGQPYFPADPRQWPGSQAGPASGRCGVPDQDPPPAPGRTDD
jgi:hypothetical protein